MLLLVRHLLDLLVGVVSVVFVVLFAVFVFVVVFVLVDEDGLDDLDALLGRVVLGKRHGDGEDAPVIGGVDVVLVCASRQRHRPDERTVGELRVPIGLGRLGALGLDRQLAVSHADLDVVGRVDARKLGAN